MTTSPLLHLIGRAIDGRLLPSEATQLRQLAEQAELDIRHRPVDVVLSAADLAHACGQIRARLDAERQASLRNAAAARREPTRLVGEGMVAGLDIAIRLVDATLGPHLAAQQPVPGGLPTVLHRTPEELRAQRAALIASTGLTETLLRERADTYCLYPEHQQVWDTVRAIDYLLDDTTTTKETR